MILLPQLLISGATHRTGSTWVQRVLTAATPYVIWGESYKLVDHLMLARGALGGASAVGEAEREKFLKGDQDPSVWVANMNPPLAAFDEGLRWLFSNYYSTVWPEGTVGYGWKEVRYGREHLAFLRTLFPAMRMILLIRDPYDTLISHKRMGWIGPRQEFRLPNICKRWSENTLACWQLAQQDALCTLVKYEEFRDRAQMVAAFVGGEWNDKAQEALDAIIIGGPKKKPKLFELEHMCISEVCGDTMRLVGYGEREWS